MMPNIMINPIDFMVLPNPVNRVGTTSCSGRKTMASTRDTRNMVRKVLYFRMDVPTTMNTNPTRIPKITIINSKF
jgi:hypothetical protein